MLDDKIYREDVVHHADALARAHGGAPGVDGETFGTIEAAGCLAWLAGLGQALRTRTDRPAPVRRVMTPKPGGGERPLGIPTIRDRVVQTAAELVLEPIFEADLEPMAYGYRPGRSGSEAIEALRALIATLPGFRTALRQGMYRIVAEHGERSLELGLEDLRLTLGKTQALHLIPVVEGLPSRVLPSRGLGAAAVARSSSAWR